MKRFFDICLSFLLLLFFSPILLLIILIVFISDFKNPLYTPIRVGESNRLFRMIKIRSMSLNADKTGVDSTSNNDSRITPIGRVIRKFKIDEISQLINVLIGNMSFVGPRPQTLSGVSLYTEIEKKILTVKPGITDFASIIFSDEGKILEFSEDPDFDYNQLIRPWKSRLALFYIENRNITLDVKIIFFTILSIIMREKALKKISIILSNMKADKKIIQISRRKETLKPSLPPGI
jgi:lipopolysaccharide/colanic/teichoic acid biosynthesis glycosyltransferase